MNDSGRPDARTISRSRSRSPDQVRAALTLPDHVPVVDLDARERHSVKHALITLVEHLLVLETVAKINQRRVGQEPAQALVHGDPGLEPIACQRLFEDQDIGPLDRRAAEGQRFGKGR